MRHVIIGNYARIGLGQPVKLKEDVFHPRPLVSVPSVSNCAATPTAIA